MQCFIAIGSNLGNREINIESAINRLREAKGIEVKKVSQIYERDPVGGPPQPKYLNGAIEIYTELGPRRLLAALQGIELELGRERNVKNGPRTIDLDILTYGDLKINDEGLQIPHPRMNEREFVQTPLKELLRA